MKTTLLLCTLTLFYFTGKSQSSISAARSAALNSTVLVKGVVINGPEMGTIRYLQDNAAGIAAFSTTLSTLNRGDSVQISGVLVEYRNLLEISTSTANPAPITFTALGLGIAQTPSVITAAQFNESVEGHLIKFIGCSFSASGTFSSGVNYTVNTSAGSFVARVTSSVSSLFGSAIPTGTVDIVGIGSQFCTSPTTGCTSGYQLALRDVNDITASSIGVNEMKKNYLNLFVYPNPATDKVYFKVKDHEIIKNITITDLTCKIVYFSAEKKAFVEVDNLSDGVYYILVNTQSNTYRSKLVVAKSSKGEQ